MTTARDIITRSMRLIKAIGDGEEVTASEGADGLAALNAMLDSWWTQRLAVFYERGENFTWPAAATTRTMGSGGQFSTTRPMRITQAWNRESGVDHPISLFTAEQYRRIPDKSTQSTLIESIYPEYGAALATLYAYPVPSANIDVHLVSWGQLQSFASLTTDVALPPGYERAMAYNLAAEIADEFERDVPRNVLRIATTSLYSIKRVNVQPALAVVEPGFLGGHHFNIYRGD